MLEKLKGKLHQVIFGTDTPAGKAFDIALILLIAASVLVVILESIPKVKSDYLQYFDSVEWFFTVVFTLEYLLRVWISRKPLSYVFSFFGIIDLMTVLPTYVSLLIPGAESLLVIRMLRLLRVFRIFKMVRFIHEAHLILLALQSSLRKITVFIMTVMTLVTIMGTLMYLVEGEHSGFSSIPAGMYWAIVTVTTVGFGDITPSTGLGQFIASILMLMGYAIIALPTGLVTAEFVAQKREAEGEGKILTCNNCAYVETDLNANFCKRCGESFESGY